MKHKDNIRNELQELGLKRLADFDKEPGFKVPDGYFDNLADSIIENLPIAHSEKPLRTNKFFNIRTVSAIAASLLILVVFAFSFLYLKNSKENGVFSQLPDHAYDEYFASLDEFDRMLVNEYLLELDLDELQTNEYRFSEDDEALIDYLLDEVNYQKFDPFFVIDLENK